MDVEPSITLTRMDFSAKIRQADGKEKVVIIELQKALYYHQTMRFRRYIGQQYQNNENVNAQDEALPIYPIYILGEEILERETPVIKINRHYIDLATNEIIEEEHPFIEALTHDAIVIQIPYLTGKRRTELELFLSIFDQSQCAHSNKHTILIDEKSYPEKYHSVIHRLGRALLLPKMEDDIYIEDDIFSIFNKKEAEIEYWRRQADLAEERCMKAKQLTTELTQKIETTVREKLKNSLLKVEF